MAGRGSLYQKGRGLQYQKYTSLEKNPALPPAHLQPATVASEPSSRTSTPALALPQILQPSTRPLPHLVKSTPPIFPSYILPSDDWQWQGRGGGGKALRTGLR